jgi:hypothetical protein
MPDHLQLCRTGKTCFFDAATAWRRLCEIRREKLRDHDRPRRIYLCPICGFWHLTSQTNKFAKNPKTRYESR